MPDSIFDFLAPTVVRQERDLTELEFGVQPEFTSPGNAVQGGIVTAMLDAFMSEQRRGNVPVAWCLGAKLASPTL